MEWKFNELATLEIFILPNIDLYQIQVLPLSR